MNCFVCDGDMDFYFSKEFSGKHELDRVDYCKCVNCHFVASKTHLEMTQLQWERLNEQYHHTYQGETENADDPRWQERLDAQTAAISKLINIGVLQGSRAWIDYGCGDGQLAERLLRRSGIEVVKYDKYMANGANAGYDEKAIQDKKYGVVINTSVFEHIRSKESLSEILDLVSEDGVFLLHTLVSESIPLDNAWFYLLPVHCSFYTNRSMQIIFDEWKYTVSVYHVRSRMWFWFRQPPEDLEKILSAANEKPESPGDIFYVKNGFMDYWK